MNIIYISSPNLCSPHLFPRFKKTFYEQGHTETTNANEATHCFLEHHSGEHHFNEEALRIIKEKNIPIICIDNREFGPYQEETWHPLEQNPAIYFVRNYDTRTKFPPNVYPFDWPYFQGCDYPPTTKEELCAREFDCCFIGTVSQTRQKFTDGIIKDGRLKINFQDRDHTQRFSDYNQWVNEHRKAKLYISCDGAGFTNERPNQLFSVAAMLKNKSPYQAAHPFEDGINCIEINEEPTEGDIEKVLDIINNEEWLYDIYMNGISHTKKYLSDEGVSNYILQNLKVVGYL